MPGVTGSLTPANTIGTVVVAFCAASTPTSEADHKHVHLQPEQIGDEAGEPVLAAFRKAGLQDNSLPLDVTEFPHPLPEGMQRRRLWRGRKR